MLRNLTAKALSSRLDTLRERGKVGLRAALAAPKTAEPEALPRLQGPALAKPHLALALEACQDVGSTKPQTFAKLRLLVNQLEQGRIPKLTTATVPSVKGASAAVGSERASTRRGRLLSRAFQSANQITEWRSGRESTSELH